MPTRAELLSTVERSPHTVAAHDRDGWLGLFVDDAVVEDPVGSAPAPKTGGVLGRFWDTFIAPHDIRFEIRRDHFIGNDVFRDALIHTRVRRGVEVQVPAYLLYQVVERDGALRVQRMAAHWTLAHMTRVAMSMGPRAWFAMTGLFARMIGVMGLGWVGAYLASLWRGIGRSRAKSVVESLTGAIAMRDDRRVVAVFTDGARIELGDRTVTPTTFVDALPANALLHVEMLVAAGWTASFRYRLEGANTAGEGLALLEFDRATRRIARARFFAP